LPRRWLRDCKVQELLNSFLVFGFGKFLFGNSFLSRFIQKFRDEYSSRFLQDSIQSKPLWTREFTKADPVCRHFYVSNRKILFSRDECGHQSAFCPIVRRTGASQDGL
jgi:hypothetical protein